VVWRSTVVLQYYILFSAVVGFNTLFYGLYVLEAVEEMFVSWKYFMNVLEVILGNKILWLLIKELESAMIELSSRHKLYTGKSGEK